MFSLHSKQTQSFSSLFFFCKLLFGLITDIHIYSKFKLRSSRIIFLSGCWFWYYVSKYHTMPSFNHWRKKKGKEKMFPMLQCWEPSFVYPSAELYTKSFIMTLCVEIWDLLGVLLMMLSPSYKQHRKTL